MYHYSPLNKSWPTKFLTSHDDVKVMQTRPTPSYGSRFILGEWNIHNRSGGTVVAGIGGRIDSSLWSFRFWDDSEYAAGTVHVDETADAKSTTTGDVNLDTVSTNNDGFAIGCDVPFSLCSLVISQGSTAGTVWQVYYSIASVGTGFTNNFAEITNLYVAPDFSSVGEQLIWFDPPTDWHRAEESTLIVNRHGRSSLQVAGLTPPKQYLLVVKATTAPNSARGQMTIATLGSMVMTKTGVSDGAVLNNIGGVELALPPQCDAIMPAISVADPANRATIFYRYAG